MISADETILGRRVCLGTNQRETSRNNNLLVVGAPGTGKSRTVIEPNVMQCNSSYVIVEPKGMLRRHLAPGLAAAGYEVRTLDFSEPSRSDCSWNPLSRAVTIGEVKNLSWELCAVDGLNQYEVFWQEQASLLLESLILGTAELKEYSHDLRGIQSLASKAYEKAKCDSYLERYSCELDKIMGSLAENQSDREEIATAISIAQARLDGAQAEVQEAITKLASALGERPPHFDDRGPNAGKAHRPRIGIRFLFPDADVDEKTSELMYQAQQMATGRGAGHGPNAGSLQPEMNALISAYRDYADAMETLEAEEKRKPRRIKNEASELYLRVSSNPGKTWECVLSTLAGAIDQWRDPDLLNMLSDRADAIDFAPIGERPTALFVVVSDTDSSLYPLVGVFMSQLVDALVRHADSTPEGRLGMPVRIVLDDFATMRGGSWSSVEAWANATRSREIWWTVAIQGIGQLDQMLGHASSQGLLAACDSQVFVGIPNDPVTSSYLRSRLIKPRTLDEECKEGEPSFVLIRGNLPVITRTYDPDIHPNRVEFAFEQMVTEAG
ncbi:type IV secretory system conjugative DNA transfer family protein [Tractidigestivibacter montrealensis]|uniref:Type IV secretory system conjugative DNA transfer family protein n=1 Tax=Tractidigestivibacter montrealensis TaxID=2972466 RepID=A0ABT1Z5D2_9ACTN|nr:type IV secretory system conjugative DNA transfer family protein [Tractidigestivibacter montrealensis]MCR9035419.1 type IV secretory system conjugative DNA transfer family protein [Tractidigestivibacter montrealensis]